jgi:hypothetical protein
MLDVCWSWEASMNRFGLRVWTLTAAACVLLGRPGVAWGQAAAPDPAGSLRDSVRELQEQVRQLQAAVSELRSEAAQYRSETMALHRELARRAPDAEQTGQQPASQPGGELSADTAGPAPAEAPSDEPASPPANQEDKRGTNQTTDRRLATLEEQYQLLTGKVDEQYQDKVESASKYRVRLSGIVLLNLFSNVGTVRNLDIPIFAEPTPRGSSGGSFGGTLRQSQLGVEVFGPEVAGARTRADLRVDLAGGFENTVNGVNAGLLRLQTGTMRFDWQRTSIVAGQDSLFFSPGSPTSFASLAIPALSYAGNLWSWTPQVRAEHRFSVGESSDIVLQGGILDPVTGDPPGDVYYRPPQAGELSRQPAYAARIAWQHKLFGQPLTVGTAGYYSRQNYAVSGNGDGWAGMSDWNLPLGPLFSVSGKFYRGRAVGGIGGGVGQSVLFTEPPLYNYLEVHPLDSMGGWSQLKFRPSSKLEFNTAFGQDNPFAFEVRAVPGATGYLAGAVVRNRGSFGNVIYRPRSDVVLSAEYRYLRTFALNNHDWTAHQVNLMMGVLF